MGTEPVDYCREIEAYLCRKNDGHLIRVVGPSFDLVSAWASAGIPLKVAFAGIDRYFARYYRKGPRRRPVRIDFCDADVQDVFDEWRRAVGLCAPPDPAAAPSPSPGDGCELRPGAERPRGPSLAAHLERVLTRLSSARANGRLDAAADAVLDRVSRELDVAGASAHGLRGAARRALLDRLGQLDRELLDLVHERLNEGTRGELERLAHEELSAFRSRMTADAYARAHAAVVTRLLRDRFNLPELQY